jgi:thiamine transport system permease protein
MLPFLFLGIFYFFPLIRILAISFSRGEVGVFQAISEALVSKSIQGVLAFTFWQALLSMLLTLLVSIPAAWIFARFEFRGKDLLRALSAIPFVLPTLVVATAFSALFGPRGWINLALMDVFGLEAAPIQFVNTFWAILIAHIFYNATIVLRMLGDFWARIDPSSEMAARTLGASPFRAFAKVTLPMLMPALLASALLVFIFDFTSFGVVLILGGPQFSTLEVEIYNQAIGLFNLPLAASLSLLQLIATLTMALLYSRLSKKLSQPIGIVAPKSNRRPLSAARHKAWLIAYLLLFTAFFASPLLGLAGRSVSRLDADKQQRGEVEKGLTFDYYRALFTEERDDIFFAHPVKAIQTSLIYAGATVGLAMLIGLPAAWGIALSKKTVYARILDPLMMLPIGTSAVTLGLGFIVALNRPPLDLRASPLLVPIAHTLVALPFVVRSLVPALRSIKPQLRAAASVLGASPQQILRFIDLPLVGRAVLVSATFVFAISLGEFGATALIARPEFPTIPTMIFKLLGQPGGSNYGQAMALSTLLMLLTGGGILAIERLRVAEVGEF